jgi:uncharacterized protein (DUF983 family)
MVRKHLLNSILHEKCPHCSGGKVFKKRESFFQLPEMNSHCENCGYQYDREPGYFLGAMYISYGLAVFQGILTFLLFTFLFPQMATIWSVVAVILVITLLSMKNYKLSRIIYIHIFPG